MGNSNHDERGRFSSGSDGAAASGDHAAVSPSMATRNVAGRNVPRSQPITRHNGAQSLGTDKPRFVATAGGLKPKVTSTGLSQAAREKVALGREVDRSYRATPQKKATCNVL